MGSRGAVAIIGAGISGLTNARYLRAQGFEVTVFESFRDLGGQWNRDNPNSGVWPEMRTNTSRLTTKLSDVQYPDQVRLYPRNTEVLAMVEAFVQMHGLRPFIRLSASVTALTRADAGYEVEWEEDGTRHRRRFDRVVVASGRFNLPNIPPISGFETFSGSEGAIHAFRYKDPKRYRDKHVVVLGGSVSALEIASDLAMLGTERVYLSQRRQRYVNPKVVAGTPLEYHTLTREIAIQNDTLPADVLLEQARERVMRLSGDPRRYGVPAPHPDFARAGVTAGQHYYALVAEDRIDVRPWVESVSGRTVRFTDSTEITADAMIFGTGFDLNLPFLSPEIKETIRYSAAGMDLFEFTFHPDLPHLAFAGLWVQHGSYPVPVEQQARYIAYCWGGRIPAPTREELVRGVQASVEEDRNADYQVQNRMALRFARLAGVDPADVADDELQLILAKSAVTGDMFRIVGPDADPGAADRLRRDFWMYGSPESQAAVLDRFPGADAGFR